MLLSRASRCLSRASALSNGLRSFTSDSKRLNLAVVGTGRMGRIRLAGMQNDPRVSIAAIVDSNASAEQLSELRSQYGAPCFVTLAEAGDALKRQNEAVDGVWISTPTPTHLGLLNGCATGELGASVKAIGIEKPVAALVSEIDEAYQVCHTNDVKLFCSFQRRFDPSYEALRVQCVDKQSIGKLQSIHTVFRDHPCPPVEFLKTGGDPFHDLAVHDIDYVCDLVGEYPTKVYAHGTSLSAELRELNVMDKASVWLEFPTTGVVCTMDLSRSAEYGYDQRVEVAGEHGMLQVQNPSKTAMVQSTKAGIAADTLSHSFPERFREAYLLELDSFIAVVQGNANPRVHWGASRMNTIIAEAARIAAVEKKVVTIKYSKTKQTAPRCDPILECEYEF
ncbi:Oxidoreductase [Phytophthora megakarya]|uniref:Oxidoreductase n=1 Tax=Phytophthora megakarya TaxID=4795 RepID=A0A225W7E2_9STRA|nr:Oxidoreductase [Phytophthora megakarya]